MNATSTALDAYAVAPNTSARYLLNATSYTSPSAPDSP